MTTKLRSTITYRKLVQPKTKRGKFKKFYPVANKLSRMVTQGDKLLPKKSDGIAIMWYCKIIRQNKNLLSLWSENKWRKQNGVSG